MSKFFKVEKDQDKENNCYQVSQIMQKKSRPRLLYLDWPIPIKIYDMEA